MKPTLDNYDDYLAKWKAKNGVTDHEANGVELKMLAEDAKDPGHDYCIECGQQFLVSAMRLITRGIDPYVQFDDDGNNDEYIAKEHRVRTCKKCFEERYEDVS